jgi:glutathione S-transferase
MKYDFILIVKNRLLPDGALQRAQVRFAIEYFSSKVSSEWYKFLQNFKSAEAREAYDKNINAALVRVRYI